MVTEDIGKAILAGVLFVWANREMILATAAEAVALAEKSQDGSLSNEALENLAVKAFRQVKALRFVPELFVRLAIRQVCARRRKAAGKMAGNEESDNA